jgi:hypothetical protein
VGLGEARHDGKARAIYELIARICRGVFRVPTQADNLLAINRDIAKKRRWPNGINDIGIRKMGSHRVAPFCSSWS